MTIRGLGIVAIGAGARGVNLHVEAAGLLGALDATEADVTNPSTLDPAQQDDAPGA